MISKKNLTAFIAGLLFLSPLTVICQVLPVTNTLTPEDTVRTVEILPGVKKLEYRKIDSITEVQILTGNVRLRQGTSIFECDSCVINKRLNLFEAFGNVHINDSDTSDIYADHLRYLTDKRMAYLDNHVRLTDGKGTLTTPYLEYDVNTKVGIYKKGGKVVNKKTVLTSEEGYYYADLKDVYFKKNVKLKDPKYELESDSLLYNTESETARFIAETFIKDSSGRTIKTREGYYNQQTGKAEFGQRPVIQDGAIQATGEKIFSDDSSGTTQIIGRAILVDTAAGRTVLADEIFFNNKNESFLATKKPLMIIKQENDSIFISADTLFSARLSDLYSQQESTKQMDTSKTLKADDKMTKDNKKQEVPDSLLTSKPNKAKKKKDRLLDIKPTDSKTKDSTNLISTDTLISAGLTEPDKKKDTTTSKELMQETKSADLKIKDSRDLSSAGIAISPRLTEPDKKKDTATDKNPREEIKPADLKSRDSKNLISTDTQISKRAKKPKKKKHARSNKDLTQEIKPVDLKSRDSVNLISAGNQISNRIIEPNKKKDTLINKDTVKEIKLFDSKTKDSANLAPADTSLSTELSEPNKKKEFIENDTLKKVKVIEFNPKDSSNRYFEAYRHVRIYTDSLQAVCDSMFYSFKDSVFRLYNNPVVWAKESQITGDTILLHTKNKKADRMEVFKNSFLVNLVKQELYNQIKAVRLDAYFKDGSLDSVRAKGQAEAIYYIQDEDSAFTGINQSTCELMDIFFHEKELQRVVFRSQVKGTIWPMQQKTPQEMRLGKFKWLDAQRPKTRYELFE